MVGIHTHLGGKVERNRKSGNALRQKIAIAPIALFGGSKAGVLAHGPKPGAIHVRIDPSREGVLAGLITCRFGAHDLEILRAFQKEETPNHPMRATNRPPTICSPMGSLPRTIRYPNTVAKTMKTKPIA